MSKSKFYVHADLLGMIDDTSTIAENRSGKWRWKNKDAGGMITYTMWEKNEIFDGFVREGKWVEAFTEAPQPTTIKFGEVKVDEHFEYGGHGYVRLYVPEAGLISTSTYRNARNIATGGVCIFSDASDVHPIKLKPQIVD